VRKGAVGNNDRVASARRRIATPRTRLRLPGVPDPNPKRQLREFKTATSAGDVSQIASSTLAWYLCSDRPRPPLRKNRILNLRSQ
jgi:hypothetical protein